MRDEELLYLKDYYIPEITNPDKFQEFVKDYYNSVDANSSYNIYGRRGQGQGGVDIISFEKKTVIQCHAIELYLKGDSRKTVAKIINKLEDDFNSFLNSKYHKKNIVECFVFACNYTYDTEITRACSDLSKNTEGINVVYKCWDDFIVNLPKRLLSKYFRDIFFGIEFDNSQSDYFKFVVDRKYSTEEILYNYFKFIFRELDVLPQYVLNSSPVFKLDNEPINYFDSFFVINSNNLEVINYFKNLTAELAIYPELIKKNEKLEFILKKLRANSIFYIRDDVNNEYISLHYAYDDCDCLRCSLQKFKFRKVFADKELNNPSGENILTSAYVNYELGNFKKSTELFGLALSYFQRKEKFTKALICQYNLNKLYPYLALYYDSDEWKNKYNYYDLPFEYSQNRSRIPKEASDWFINNSYFNSLKNRTISLVQDLRWLYYNKSSYSVFNNKALNLLRLFMEIYVFIKGNFIVYTITEDFKRLFNNVLEGVLIAYSLKEKFELGIKKLDAWFLLRIIEEADAQELFNYLKSYEIGDIEYIEAGVEDNVFNVSTCNFFSETNSLSFFNEINSEYKWFEKKCEKYFFNFLIISSYLKESNGNVNKWSAQIINFINLYSNSLSFEVITLLCNYINKKGMQFDVYILIGLWDLGLKNNKLHNSNYFNSVIEVFNKRNIQLDLTSENIKVVLNIAFEKCNSCNFKHDFYFIHSLFKIVNASNKLIIEKYVSSYLKQNFNSEIYHYLLINGLIKFTKKDFTRYIEDCKVPSVEGVFKDSFLRQMSISHYIINNLLNLCYKLEISLDVKMFASFKEINSYYNWLFNIESFDYSRFDPTWLKEYKSEIFYERFKKQPIIKDLLLEYLQNNNDPILKDIFIKIA